MSRLRVARAVLLATLMNSVAAANGVLVADFAHAPHFAHAALSPNGALISYVDQIGDRQIVLIRGADQREARATLTVEPPNERVRWCGWADDRYLLCGTTLTSRKQHRLVEHTKLYAIDSVRRITRELGSRHEGAARNQVIDLMPTRPELVLRQQHVDGRGFPEVVELNVATGKSHVVVRSYPPIRSWMSDGQGEVRLGLGYEGHVATLFTRKAASDRWETALTQSLNDPEAIGPLAFGAAPLELYVLKHHRGRAALFRLDLLESTKPTLLFANPLFDVSGPLVLDPRSREPLAVRYLAESPATHFFADREREAHDWLNRELPGVVNEIATRSSDGSRLVVISGSDVDPPSLYLADLKTRQLRLLGHQFPNLEGRPLAPMRGLMYAARDGQRIPAYLTVPPNRLGPGPAIVLPHGGPETRDVRKFEPLVQFFVAQGYVVLQMNYRGSLGYGAGFAAAGARQWGGVMHNDITDGARWLVEQRIADPEKLCIVGTSYGGYAALLGAARESQWYACAASFAGLSDLLAFASSTQRQPDADLWAERLGTDTRALWQMSPLALAWRIETPVLLVHGRRDAVVPVSQSRRLARALRAAQKDHELIERSECDHEMTATACRIAVFDALATFLNDALRPSAAH